MDGLIRCYGSFCKLKKKNLIYEWKIIFLCNTRLEIWKILHLRVLRTLKEVDLIAAEDTRNSIKLLNHFDIKTPMTSYHEYNKIDKAYVLIEKMQEWDEYCTDYRCRNSWESPTRERSLWRCVMKQELK